MLRTNFNTVLAEGEHVTQIMRFTDIYDAFGHAGNTSFGFTVGMCCRDAGKAMGIARRLRVGSVWINTWNRFDDETTFGQGSQRRWSPAAIKSQLSKEECKATIMNLAYIAVGPKARAGRAARPSALPM